MTKPTMNREQWLTEACDFILTEEIMPIVSDQFPRPKIKVSLGFAFRSNKAVGQCFKRWVSAQAYNEIFIKPDTADSLNILDTLTHELIHAVDNCASGHKGFFRKTAIAVGLTGKMTSTVASPELAKRLNAFTVKHGHIPHSEMNLAASDTTKKQTTRMKKLVCGNCGFTARTSQKWLDMLETKSDCLVCGFTELEKE